MTKTISEIQKEAKKYITRNKFNDALELVNDFISKYDLSNSPIEKHFIVISKEYFDIRQRGINGVLTHEEIRRIEANLTSRFLILIDDLNELEERDLSLKNNDFGGLVSADYYLNTQLNNIIAQVISSDDKINDLKITIEEKKIEITKTRSAEKIKTLNNEVAKLKRKLEEEKENFNTVKSEYDELKSKYDELTKEENGKGEQVKSKCKKCSLELTEGSKCLNCGYENDDLKMIRTQLNSFKTDFEFIAEKQKEKNKIFNEVKRTNSMILQYLDDLNRRLSKIEKKMK